MRNVAAFNFTFPVPWHYTFESVLPAVSFLSAQVGCREAELVFIPEGRAYPCSLLEKISAKANPSIQVERTTFILPKWPRHHSVYGHSWALPEWCAYVDKQVNTMKPYLPVVNKVPNVLTFYLFFKLAYRNWPPLQKNIQTLVDNIHASYPGSQVILVAYPKAECDMHDYSGEDLNIRDVVGVYDKSFEETLAYALISDYAICVDGSGMVYPHLARVPTVLMSPYLPITFGSARTLLKRFLYLTNSSKIQYGVQKDDIILPVDSVFTALTQLVNGSGMTSV